MVYHITMQVKQNHAMELLPAIDLGIMDWVVHDDKSRSIEDGCSVLNMQLTEKFVTIEASCILVGLAVLQSDILESPFDEFDVLVCAKFF